MYFRLIYLNMTRPNLIEIVTVYIKSQVDINNKAAINVHTALDV